MKRASCLVVLALVLAAPAALAQPGTFVGTFTASPGQSFKTPPLADSDSFVLRINTHIAVSNLPFAGWSGSIVKVHILDNTEADVVATHAPFFRNRLGPPNGPVLGPSVVNSSPFGPPSNNIQSVPVSFNIYTNAPSGFSVFTSDTIGIVSALIHAKNTTPTFNNSDIDATVMLWNIWHLRVSSTNLPAPPSFLVWVTSLGLNPGGTLGDPEAHWTHLTGGTLHAQQSAYFASFVGTILVGIEHVPEPATGGLLAGGLLALAGSRAARRRRLNA